LEKSELIIFEGDNWYHNLEVSVLAKTIIVKVGMTDKKSMLVMESGYIEEVMREY